MSLIRGNIIVILVLVFSEMVLPPVRRIVFLWLLLLILSDWLLINKIIPSHFTSDIFLWLFLFIIADLIFVRLKTRMKRKEEIRQKEIEELMVTRKPWWIKHI
jgi:hypothetical protein